MKPVNNSYIPSPGSFSTDDMQYFAIFGAYDMGGHEMYTVEIYRREDEDLGKKLVVVDSAVKYTPAQIKAYAHRTLQIIATR